MQGMTSSMSQHKVVKECFFQSQTLLDKPSAYKDVEIEKKEFEKLIYSCLLTGVQQIQAACNSWTFGVLLKDQNQPLEKEVWVGAVLCKKYIQMLFSVKTQIR